MSRVNPEIRNFGKGEHGYSYINDENLLYVVDVNWDVIAEKLFGVVT